MSSVDIITPEKTTPETETPVVHHPTPPATNLNVTANNATVVPIAPTPTTTVSVSSTKKRNRAPRPSNGSSSNKRTSTTHSPLIGPIAGSESVISFYNSLRDTIHQHLLYLCELTPASAQERCIDKALIDKPNTQANIRFRLLALLNIFAEEMEREFVEIKLTPISATGQKMNMPLPHYFKHHLLQPTPERRDDESVQLHAATLPTTTNQQHVGC